MTRLARVFEDAPMTRNRTPLIIGITGCQGSGKTWSALRLATGVQSVVGGDIFGIDTEANRMKSYADYFKGVRHVPFAAPFGPLDYRDAIDHCVRKGARIIVIDSMTHEHEGEGGLLDQIDDFLERKAGDDWAKRDKLLMAATIAPKRARKKLNNRIEQLGDLVTFILCYRAENKIKPKAGGTPERLGWLPVTTSNLPFLMTVSFLLTPRCEGVPTLLPTSEAEKALTKNPHQFQGWFTQGVTLSEDIGRRLAEWANGGTGVQPTAIDVLLADYAKCEDEETYSRLEVSRGELWKKPGAFKPQLKAASEAARKRLDELKKKPESGTTSSGGADAQAWIATAAGLQVLAEYEPSWNACTEAFGGLVPLDVGDAYENARERLTELAARQEDM